MNVTITRGLSTFKAWNAEKREELVPVMVKKQEVRLFRFPISKNIAKQ